MLYHRSIVGNNFNTSFHWCDNLLYSKLVDILEGGMWGRKETPYWDLILILRYRSVCLLYYKFSLKYLLFLVLCCILWKSLINAVDIPGDHWESCWWTLCGFAKCKPKRLSDEKCIAICEFMFYLTSLENLWVLWLKGTGVVCSRACPYW